LKILYHHRTLAEDGQAVHIRALQQAFRAEGHEVLEVALVPRASTREPAAPARVERSNGGARSRWNLVGRLPRFARELSEYAYGGFARPRIVAAAARFRPDFVYERYAFGNAGGVLAARKLGRPLVLEVNSPMVLELGNTRGLSFPHLAARVEGFVFRGASVVCVVSSVLADMVQELGVERERVLVTPNGVDLELYPQADPAARPKALARLGLSGAEAAGEVVLGFVGFYREWHRLDLVLECLARPELARARLVLVGGGPVEEALRARALELGVSERVHFAGPRPHADVPELLPAFDVALVPAINPYASPLKLFEYMAAARAVVAPDQPNLREVIAQGANGRLVEPGDRESLLGALTELCADPALRVRLGLAARRTIEERDLTWRGNARRVVAAVEALA
jgi:glycosyltransferase involved in cell wall biosynthesis